MNCNSIETFPSKVNSSITVKMFQHCCVLHWAPNCCSYCQNFQTVLWIRWEEDKKLSGPCSSHESCHWSDENKLTSLQGVTWAAVWNAGKQRASTSELFLLLFMNIKFIQKYPEKYLCICSNNDKIHLLGILLLICISRVFLQSQKSKVNYFKICSNLCHIPRTLKCICQFLWINAGNPFLLGILGTLK